MVAVSSIWNSVCCIARPLEISWSTTSSQEKSPTLLIFSWSYQLNSKGRDITVFVPGCAAFRWSYVWFSHCDYSLRVFGIFACLFACHVGYMYVQFICTLLRCLWELISHVIGAVQKISCRLVFFVSISATVELWLHGTTRFSCTIYT